MRKCHEDVVYAVSINVRYHVVIKTPVTNMVFMDYFVLLISTLINCCFRFKIVLSTAVVSASVPEKTCLVLTSRLSTGYSDTAYYSSEIGFCPVSKLFINFLTKIRDHSLKKKRHD